MSAPRVLLDANVLLLLVVGSVEPALISEFKRTAMFDKDDYHLLLDMLPRASTIVSTPHVLTEVNGLMNQLRSDQKAVVRGSLKALVGGLSEANVPATTVVEHALFYRLGLTDAAVACLADAGDLLVVTVDFDLWASLKTAGLEAVNFNHHRAAADRLN